ncbi:hypothetical protein BDN72DRAFT_898434 [Pluteus cervinus]|uniref:Uncharacterized protein n=1 Tax=Pluteus cervinus TaxID=181527 RepID=A0ACD3AR18_9AGAR|nr:hypothetical protein BDN72DRAFT_898434 [Pluteus cervinus]
MALDLPQEVIDLVIEHTDIFKTCSLLSHACLHFSRKHLFKTISISDKTCSQHDAPEDSHFFRFWINSPHLHAYVKVIRLSWSIPNRFKQLDTLIKPFIHLPTIQIHLFSASAAHEEGPGFTSIIEHFAHPGSKLSTSITSLVSQDYNLHSPLAFTAFPNLKVLRVLGQSILPPDFPAVSLSDTGPSKRVQLDELEVRNSVPSGTLTWLERSIECSRLRIFKLRCSRQSSPGYSKFASLVNHVAPNIHTLSFEPPMEVERVGHEFPPCIISFSQFPLLRKLDLYRGIERFPRTFFRWTLRFLSDLPPTNLLQEITFNFPMLMLPVPPVPVSGDQTQSNTGIEGESQRILREFFISLLVNQYKESKDALDSITEFDALLMDFVNLKTLRVISKAPDTFFRERLPRLNETGRLVLQPPSPAESSVGVF